MSCNRQYPGSRWWRFDFHVHTPASVKDYKKPETTPDKWLKSCMDAGLDCVVVTDHNSGDWFGKLKTAHAELAAITLRSSFTIFPGVEITVGSTHLLAIFDPDSADEKTITAILAQCGITKGYGDPETLAVTSMVETIEIIKKANGIPVAAHIDGNKGLLEGAPALNPDLERNLKELRVAEFCNLDYVSDNPELQQMINRLAKVGGSDAHTPEDIGRHGSWIKMSRPSIEGLRLALMDHEFCVFNGVEDPNQQPDVFVTSLKISNMRHCGRIPGQPFELSFHPGFNAVIGGRGSGKSTTIDAMRLAARRHEELSDFTALNADLERFKAHSSKGGVMEGDTEILLGFCRRGDEYRLRWRSDSQGDVFERRDGENWDIAEPGNLLERLPLSMFSQKQLYELAENPGGLLNIIDRSPEVSRAEWERRWEAATSQFLELRLLQRKFKQELSNEPEICAKLADLEKDLKLYEERGHGDIFKQYQKRIEQQRAMPLEDDFGNLAGRLLQMHEEAQLEAFPLHLFPEDDPARLELAMIHGEAADSLGMVQQRLCELVNEIDTIAKKRTEALRASQWYGSVVAATKAYDTLVCEYETKNSHFDPSLYGRWVQEKTRLQSELAGFEAIKREQVRVAGETARALEILFSLRKELSEKRIAFITTVIGESKYVRMELVPFGDVERLDVDYRTILSLDGNSFKASILDEDGGLLRKLSHWRKEGTDAARLPEMINEIKVSTERLAGGDSTDLTMTKPFVSRLQKVSETHPANLDKLWCWWPEDLLRVKHVKDLAKAKFEELERGSAGQKAAAILAFLLSHGTEPLIIDQPEDDLDNALIYDLVVRQIKENKLRRQLIIVTHNPNIVVNGDAELVHVLHVSGGQIQPAAVGGLEEQAVRDRICDIMEGGREAFCKRYNRIMLEV